MLESVFLKSNRVETSREAWSTALRTSCMSTWETTSKVGTRTRYRRKTWVGARVAKGADCKSAGAAYGGSNPPRPTKARGSPGSVGAEAVGEPFGRDRALRIAGAHAARRTYHLLDAGRGPPVVATGLSR